MKHILLIMTDFYGYHQSFIEAIEKHGYIVHWICNRPKLDLFARIRKKIDKEYFFKLNERKLTVDLAKFKDSIIDKIIVVYAGDYMNRNNMLLLKRLFPSAELIYYDWDSLKFYPNVVDFLDLCDRKYSFDSVDCDKYAVNGLKLRPLFYVNESSDNEFSYDYDVSTFMTFDIRKAKQLSYIKNLLNCNLSKFLFVRMRFKSTYYTYKFKYPRIMKRYSASDFTNELLSGEDIRRLIIKSRVVIDIPLEGQNGLTMRTFETLALRRKLITTNKNVIKYDFYNPNNIFVVDENTKEIPLDFFKTPFDDSSVLSTYYSLDSFVKVLLGEIECVNVIV